MWRVVLCILIGAGLSALVAQVTAARARMTFDRGASCGDPTPRWARVAIDRVRAKHEDRPRFESWGSGHGFGFRLGVAGVWIEDRFEFETTYASGWPFAAFVSHRDGHDTARKDSAWIAGVKVPKNLGPAPFPGHWERYTDERVFPLTPTWGWLLNAVVYAVPIWGGLGVVCYAVRRRRRHEGRCPWCGYDLAGSRRGCPECGPVSTGTLPSVTPKP